MLAYYFAFFRNEPPVLVDWLPWNHTFGGNHNFGLVLYNGGTLWIDEGKPVGKAIETTVQNLREIAPTIYFNVPKGFELLLPYLRADKNGNYHNISNTWLAHGFLSSNPLSPFFMSSEQFCTDSHWQWALGEDTKRSMAAMCVIAQEGAPALPDGSPFLAMYLATVD
jgi:acyl-CoA synthetase (AMP-forming)/AMP-acid ligase II